jgi:hydroxymethylglutaryl-CoA lyase
MPEPVEIVEVGPRDGLQAEARLVPAADKIALVDRLSACGFRRIEVTSFVSPRAVPQMADAAEVMAGIARAPGVAYGALTPNLRGLEAALAAGADTVAVFASASDGFSRANINCTVEESLVRFGPVLAAAAKAAVPVRGYVSCVIRCPYDGPVAPARVAAVAARLAAMGCAEISLGDTIGAGDPDSVTALLRAVLDAVPAARLAGHFHDTGGRALDNVAASLACGLRVFDAAAGGLGGCPYAPGAPGNVATEALAAMLAARGHPTGLDPARLQQAAELARGARG